MKTLRLIIATLKLMIKDLMDSYFFIPIFVLIGMVAFFYGYCFVAEHEILSFKQKTSFESAEFTITAKCRPIDAFTSVPYVSVYIGEMEIVTTSVNAGYDFTTQCMNSSVKHVQLIESERKIKIYMQNGQVKEIPIIYNSN